MGGDTYQSGNQSKYVNNLVSQRNSTFFPHLRPDVKMTEEDERDAELAIHFSKGTPSGLSNRSLSSDTNNSIGDWNIVNGLKVSPHDTEHEKVNGFQLPDKDYYLQLEDVSDEE